MCNMIVYFAITQSGSICISIATVVHRKGEKNRLDMCVCVHKLC